MQICSILKISVENSKFVLSSRTCSALTKWKRIMAPFNYQAESEPTYLLWSVLTSWGELFEMVHIILRSNQEETVVNLWIQDDIEQTNWQNMVRRIIMAQIVFSDLHRYICSEQTGDGRRDEESKCYKDPLIYYSNRAREHWIKKSIRQMFRLRNQRVESCLHIHTTIYTLLLFDYV